MMSKHLQITLRGSLSSNAESSPRVCSACPVEDLSVLLSTISKNVRFSRTVEMLLTRTFICAENGR